MIGSYNTQWAWDRPAGLRGARGFCTAILERPPHVDSSATARELALGLRRPRYGVGRTGWAMGAASLWDSAAWAARVRRWGLRG